jgi:signal transduction histidine kinase
MNARRQAGKPLPGRPSPPVVVTFDDAEVLLDVVGDIDRFVAGGDTREDVYRRLLDLLPWQQSGLEAVQAVELSEQCYADINILSDGELRHFVLMDVSELMQQLQRNQQADNDLVLAQRRELRALQGRSARDLRREPLVEFRRSTLLLADIAHEARDALATLAGHAHRLRARCEGDPAALRSLAAIHQATIRLGALSANALIALGDTVAGGGSGPIEPQQLAALLQDTFTMQARDRGLDFQVRIANAAPHLAKDHLVLRQLLINLVIHAFEGIEAGSLVVGLSTTAGQLDVEIASEPCGFPEQHFSALVTTDHAPQSGAGGGLGLAVGQRLLRQLGARVEVVARGTGGHELWFRVPADGGADA